MFVMLLQLFNGIADPTQRLPLNSAPIPFESDLFKGQIAVFIRHLPSTPAHMFKGKKRVSWIVIQVQLTGRLAGPSLSSNLGAGHLLLGYCYLYAMLLPVSFVQNLPGVVLLTSIPGYQTITPERAGTLQASSTIGHCSVWPGVPACLQESACTVVH